MSRIAEALRQRSETDFERATLICAGSKFHSPTPLVVLKTPVGEEIIPLCGTCRDNLGVFLSLMTTSNGSLPWEVRREFGNRIRSLGMTAWLSSHPDTEEDRQ